MKIRDLLILTAALCLLSVLVGLAILFYLYVWGAPSSTAVTPTVGLAARPSPTAAGDRPNTPSPGLPSLVTPTSTSTRGPTVEPTETPTAAPSPTPAATATSTPLPSARLAGAYRAKRNGDYRLARSEFRVVLDGVASEADIAESLYELAVCAYLDGEHAAARELLQQFIVDHPEDHRVPAAHYHLAQALRELGDYGSAVQNYRAYLDRQDTLADLVYTQIGDAHFAQSEYENAVDAYQRALERATDLSQQYDLREQIGVTYSAWGKPDQAIAWLTEITDLSENVYRLARIWYLIGQVHRMAGRKQEALDAFARATDIDPRPGYAYAALVELLDAYVPVDEFQRGLIDYHAESYGVAVAAFYRYMESTPDYRSDAHYYVALSYLASESYDLAVQECERALEKYPDTIPHWGDLWLIRARALADQDRVDEAVTAYLEFADGNPEHPLAAESLWQAAHLHESAGACSEAANIYTALADRYVNAEKAPSARFRAGICRLRAGDPDAAVTAWRDLVQGYPASGTALPGRYWLGRTLWAQGAEQEAKSMLQQLAEQHPRDYYGLRAAHLLDNAGQPAAWPPAPTNLRLSTDLEGEKKEAEVWLRSWSNTLADGNLESVPEDMANDLRFRRAMELLALERRDLARDEFENLRQDIAQDPAALLRFALLTRDLGMYAPSLRAAIALIVLAPELSVLDTPPLVQRLAFPTYYSDLIVPESQEYGIDPLVMFALIRQESVFDAQATSWAGAVGLTQIMPETGQWIAEMMPWPDYDQDDLTKAYLNARLGTWFLARILEMTDGNIPAALAGYNGGPGNAVHWLEMAGSDPDLFVEVISRSEPRLYVQEIYRHYDAYVRLYGVPQE